MKKKMNILLVADNASAKMGGEAILPLHYFKRLPNEDHNVFLLTHERVAKELNDDYKEYIDNIYFIKDTLFQKIMHRISFILPKRVMEVTTGFMINVSSGLRFRKKAIKIIKAKNIDIVHQTTPVSPKAPSFMYNLKKPVIIGPLNGGMEFPENFKDIAKPSERLFYKIGRMFSNIINRLIPGKIKANLILVSNERTKKALPTNATKNVEVLVENGVDLSLWEYNDQNLKKSDKLFTFLGFLKDWKGIDYLLKGFKIALEEEKDIKLQIIGDGPEKKKLEKLAKELDIEKSVDFKGFVKQEKCPELLKKSRALVLTSLFECGGAVVLEAMALGIPSIATNWGGPSDYLDDNCGILIDPISKEQFVKDIAKAIIKLSSDKEWAIKLGTNGRVKAEEEYDWDKKIIKIINIYKRYI